MNWGIFNPSTWGLSALFKLQFCDVPWDHGKLRPKISRRRGWQRFQNNKVAIPPFCLSRSIWVFKYIYIHLFKSGVNLSREQALAERVYSRTLVQRTFSDWCMVIHCTKLTKKAREEQDFSVRAYHFRRWEAYIIYRRERKSQYRQAHHLRNRWWPKFISWRGWTLREVKGWASHCPLSLSLLFSSSLSLDCRHNRWKLREIVLSWMNLASCHRKQDRIVDTALQRRNVWTQTHIWAILNFICNFLL